VSVRTLGEYIRRLMGAGEIPPLRPVFDSVSRTISSLILLKSWNFWPGMCRNSPHSSLLEAESDVLTSSATPFDCVCGARLISWRMRGRRVTIPVPRGRLYSVSVLSQDLLKLV
jgi:hypothetical protein